MRSTRQMDSFEPCQELPCAQVACTVLGPSWNCGEDQRPKFRSHLRAHGQGRPPRRPDAFISRELTRRGVALKPWGSLLPSSLTALCCDDGITENGSSIVERSCDALDSLATSFVFDRSTQWPLFAMLSLAQLKCCCSLGSVLLQECRGPRCEWPDAIVSSLDRHRR